MKDEGIANKYLEIIKDEPSRANVHLTRMFGELFNARTDGKHYGIFGKAVKLYGWKITFFALLDMYDMDNVDTNNFYNLLAYFAKKRLENANKQNYINDLSEFAKKQEEDLGKNHNITRRELE